MLSAGTATAGLIGTLVLLIGASALPQGVTGTESDSTGLTGERAEVEVLGDFEPDTFGTGVKLFSNRSYKLRETPALLEGQAFVRGVMEQMVFRCTKSGAVTVLTPDPAHPRAASRCQELEARGFVRVAEPKTFQLFGDAEFDRVRIYRKHLVQGEEFRLGKWVLLVGPKQITRWQPSQPRPWTENTGELLYNGIRLPKEWPPSSLDPKSAEPMPVPYLQHPPKVIPIDAGRQLFVDDFLVEATDLKRAFHKAQKFEGNPVLAPQTQLELNPPHNAIACPKSGGVWWDSAQQVFRMWYEAGWLHTICLATSRDGLHWDRPDLDLQPGSNRVLDPSIRPDSWTVFPDYDGTDPSAGWKMFLRSPGGQLLPGMSMVSADGIHWSQPSQSGLTGDRSTMFYNPFRKKWVYSLRTSVRGRSRHYWECDDFLAGAQWGDIRSGSGERTPVFWAAADQLDRPDPDIGEPAQLYNLDAVAYESIMLGIYQIHLGPANAQGIKTGLPKITELNLAYSRDGFHWHRPDRTPFIPAARRDVWDRGYVQSVGGLCLVRGDRLWFYYIGFQGDPTRTNRPAPDHGMYHRGSTGVAFLRRDGFVSLDAGPRGGTLTTRLVRFSGAHLFVNVACARGALKAEVLDEDGRVIEPFTLERCLPVATDSTRVRVSWQDAASLATLKDRPVRFRFHLKDGSLFAFWVSPAASGESNGYVGAGGPEFSGYRDSVASPKPDPRPQRP